ncbi:sensor histidine kinase [Aliikangiella marina]|uniref:Sensor histidine kinase n=1 Tax=Aliikangiella marina TaxID=1712262 RepID=A0A545T4I1_9GAMM|nr:histidine kinase [Aliikangiella marina]TQV72137.1 sensor histidine kinase [Aliikangiella marina]
MLPVKKAKDAQEFFLPDFCQPQSLFLVVLVGELLAVIFTLLNFQPQANLWNLLGIYSISIQIIALISVSLLCWLRPWLAKYSDWVSGALSLSVILFATLVFTYVVIRYYWQIPIDLTQQAQSNIFLRHVLIAGLIGAVALRYFYLQQQYRQKLASEASARLEALQARIRPHFLFNSMNVIASLTRIDPAKAEAAIEDLSDLFRATLENKQDLIPFSEELQNAERYLAIEKIRLGDRMQVKKSVSADCLQVLVPPLSVQPLVENAVYHGIQMLPDGGTVDITAELEGDLMKICVANPRAREPSHKGHGIALKNIGQRLEVIYSGKANLHRRSDEDFYKVTMSIPLKQADESK